MIMKELSIEEKAKAYDEALERAKDNYNAANSANINVNSFKNTLIALFPELKESEDEKIRKAVIEMIHDTPSIECEENYNVCKNDILAWLEKQKDTNVLIQEASEKAYTEGMRVERKHWLEKQDEQKPILDFKASNWYVSKVDGKIHDLTYNPADNKELKKLGQSEVTKTGEQIWSEEDNKRLVNTTISFLKDYADKGYENAVECIDWLKSLKTTNVGNSSITVEGMYNPTKDASV